VAGGGGDSYRDRFGNAGFWLVKQYFNMTVAETFKTWTAMETILSIVALGFILLLSLFV
jgi:GntP family gluconate:H+ symporter